MGAIEAPVNTNYKGEWLRHVVNNTQAEVVLTEARFSQPLLDIAHQLTHVKYCVVFGSFDSAPRSLPFNVLSEADFLQGVTVRERAEPAPWDISSLIYTSGTTGRSKAVMVPWRQLKSSLESGMIPRDRLQDISLYSPYPVFHVTGKAGFYYATVFGNPSVIREAFSPSDFWADIKRHEPNGLVLLGPLAQMMLDQPPRADDANNPIRTVVMAPVIPDVDGFSAAVRGARILTAKLLSATSGFDRFDIEGGKFELSRNGTREQFRGDGSEVIIGEALKYISRQVALQKPVFVVIGTQRSCASCVPVPVSRATSAAASADGYAIGMIVASHFV